MWLLSLSGLRWVEKNGQSAVSHNVELNIWCKKLSCVLNAPRATLGCGTVVAVSHAETYNTAISPHTFSIQQELSCYGTEKSK